MIATTGNWRRDACIRECIAAARAENGPTDFESIAARLPTHEGPFDLGRDEYDQFMAEHVPVKPPAIEGAPVAPVEPEPAKTVSLTALSEPAPAEAVAPATADQSSYRSAAPVEREPVSDDDIAQAERVLVETQAELADSRACVVQCERAEREARLALSEAIADWQSGFPRFTRDDLVRQHIASEQEQRAKMARGELPSRRHQVIANSTVDRMAYGRGSIETGKYGAHRRGAFGAEHRGRKVQPQE